MALPTETERSQIASGLIRGEVLDAVIEVVVHARGPAARAAVISELVQEMWATVEWLHASGPELASQADELTSITQLSRAARDHLRRMSASRQLASAATVGEALRLRPVGNP